MLTQMVYVLSFRDTVTEMLTQIVYVLSFRDTAAEIISLISFFLLSIQKHYSVFHLIRKSS